MKLLIFTNQFSFSQPIIFHWSSGCWQKQYMSLEPAAAWRDLISTTPLPQQSKLTQPSGLTPRCGYSGLTTSLARVQETCVRIIACFVLYLDSTMSSFFIPHSRGPVFSAANLLKKGAQWLINASVQYLTHSWSSNSSNAMLKSL